MFTRAKIDLINECLRYSQDIPNRIFYGLIDKDGRLCQYSVKKIVEDLIKDGCKIYCKALNGQLIL